MTRRFRIVRKLPVLPDTEARYEAITTEEGFILDRHPRAPRRPAHGQVLRADGDRHE